MLRTAAAPAKARTAKHVIMRDGLRGIAKGYHPPRSTRTGRAASLPRDCDGLKSAPIHRPALNELSNADCLSALPAR
jgi:hypothetical protein